jgi:hypothetical protein
MIGDQLKTKLILPLVAALLSGGSLHAQILVTTGTGFPSTTTVNEYNTDGTPVGSGTLVTLQGNAYPMDIAVSGTDIFVAGYFNDSINEYTTAGAPVGSGTLVTGLGRPSGIALSGSDIFVANNFGSIGEYTTSGSTVNAALVPGLDNPDGIAISGTDIFVTFPMNIRSSIAEYTTSGSLVNSNLTGQSGPGGIAVSGSDIFVTFAATNTIGEYTLAGAPVGTGTLVSSGLNDPLGIAVSGSDIFVANYGSNTVGEYTTSGSMVNADLISVGSPDAIAIIPEPSSWVLLAIGEAGLLIFTRRRRSPRSRVE